MDEKSDEKKRTYNKLSSKEKLKHVNEKNLELENEWLGYLLAGNKSPNTVKEYRNRIHIFWCWNLEYNKNKFFVNITKKDLAKLQRTAINVWNWSPARFRGVIYAVGALEKYVANILESDYPRYKPKSRGLELPPNRAVKTKQIPSTTYLKSILDELVRRESYMQACLLALAMYSGRRKAELCRFKVSYFDEENLIHSGTLYRTPEPVQIKGAGPTGTQVCLYVLARPFQPYLDLWLQQREELKITGDWLFPAQKHRGQWSNRPITTAAMDYYAKRFTRISGQHFNWQQTRDFFQKRLKKSKKYRRLIYMVKFR